MDDPVRAFYDELADAYHLLFADWQWSITYQQGVLETVIAARLGAGTFDVLDCACGIGTQAIGFARLGHRVTASDLSPAAIARLQREAAAAGLAIDTHVADLRTLAAQVPGQFNAVVALDNALPHLRTEAEVRQAVANMAAKLRPGGLLLASIRDYDRLAQERPQGDGPRVFDGPTGRRIAFQVWDWAADGETYELHQFILQPEVDGWRTDHFITGYRALRRAELTRAAEAAALVEIAWFEPDVSGYYQPIIAARKPS